MSRFSSHLEYLAVTLDIRESTVFSIYCYNRYSISFNNIFRQYLTIYQNDKCVLSFIFI